MASSKPIPPSTDNDTVSASCRDEPGQPASSAAIEWISRLIAIDTTSRQSNLGLIEATRAALAELGVDLDDLRAIEPDQALGNGGLGRLAACYMDSMACLGLPAHGYGIRYVHGLFKQHISDGWQHELPEDWLAFGNPWEFERPEVIYKIGFGGVVEYLTEDPYDALLRLEEPGPGVAALGAYSMGGPSTVAMNFYLYGEEGPGIAARESPKWEAWSREHFPATGEGE